MRTSRAALALLLAAGCGPAPPPAQPIATPTAPHAGGDYRYRVTAGPGAAQLRVEVDLPGEPPTPRTWTVDPDVQPFVHDVGVVRDGAFHAVAAGGGGWIVPGCDAGRDGGCRLQYSVNLGEAARTLADFDHAMERDGALLSPASSWLLRPQQVHAPYLLSVSTAPGESFITGLTLAPATGAGSESTTFNGDVAVLDESPYAAFGRFPVTRKRVPDGLVDVAFLRGKATPVVDAWVDHALGAVAAYYQHFPIAHAALVVRVGEGTGVSGGHTMGNGGGAVLITVGEQSDAATLRDDWVLVHELVHVSFPDVQTPWAEEGMATYLEPIIRARAGLCTADDLWRSLVEGLPQGQPAEGESGLDVTDTWGRRYWGGALFWFVADVEIRKRTGNARSLDDAFRAVNRAGGNVAVRWDLDRVLALADAGTGADVLVPLHKQWGKTPVRVDLDALWKGLGVAVSAGKMVYDDAAPLAALRRGIVGKPAG